MTFRSVFVSLHNEKHLILQASQLVKWVSYSLRWIFVSWILIICLILCVSFLAEAPSLAKSAAYLTLHAVGGLFGSFLLHELVHLVTLRVLAPGVTTIYLEITFLRVSLCPRGIMTGWQSAIVAASGPVVCLLAGCIISAFTFDIGLSNWMFLHTLFLIPIFGDGRAIVRGVARGHTSFNLH